MKLELVLSSCFKMSVFNDEVLIFYRFLFLKEVDTVAAAVIQVVKILQRILNEEAVRTDGNCVSSITAITTYSMSICTNLGNLY